MLKMINLNNLTIIIVTYKTNKKILDNCLKSIDKNIKIKIIENSNEIGKYDENFLNKYKGITVDYTGKNLGYGGGNNYGFKITDTDFALVSNPDIVFEDNFFKNIEKYLNHDLGFSIIGASYKTDKIYMPYGFFNENIKKLNKKPYSNDLDPTYSPLKKVDWVTGCTMLVNLKKFGKKEIFDENFFLYFEEFDLCKQIEINKENVFSSADLLVHHLGFKGSFAADPVLRLDAEKLREWHWMWSTFYFYKKNYGYLFAIRKTIGKLIRAFFKMLFYKITFNSYLKNKYKFRFYGLINGIIGKTSWYRVNSKFQ